MNNKCNNVFSWGTGGLLLCLATAQLSACSDSSAILSVHPSPYTTPPDKLRIVPEPDPVNALDYFALGGCALQTTLGKYHSPLGVGASDSQRLLLDLEYLRLAPQCIKHTQRVGQTELAAFLRNSLTFKREQLPATIFNATLANREFRQFWRNHSAVKKRPEQQQLTLTAIKAVNILTLRWLSGDYRASNIEFEIYLSEIARGKPTTNSVNTPGTYRAVSQLEQLLCTVLPQAYTRWQTTRDYYFTGLKPSTEPD